MKSQVKDLASRISKEYLEQLYIKDNLSKTEVAKILGLTSWGLSNLLKFYDIKKSSEACVSMRRRTCIEKYGVDNPSKSPDVKEKIKQTNIDRYGAPAFTATQEGKTVVANTKTSRYGSPTFNNPDKNRETKLSRYEDPTFNNREKMKATCISRYGVDNPFKIFSVKDSIRIQRGESKDYSPIFVELISDKEKSREFLLENKYSYHELVKVFNAPYYVVQNWASRLDLRDLIDFSFTGTSQYEDEISNFLQEIGVINVIRNSTAVLGNDQEVDIYLPDYHIGIEFNGTYWHSDLFKPKSYHQEKSKAAEHRGIRLIHIYEYEWKNLETRSKIQSLLRIACGKVPRRIYARNCTIKEISNKEARPFNEANHLQGHRNAQVTYGLFYEGELVQLMSFSRTKYNKNLRGDGDWEIIRGCPGSNNLVVGGVSKLFKYFIEKHDPDTIFSYCDFNKFDGKGYEAIGMKFIGYTSPDIHYIFGEVAVPRNPSKYKYNKENCDYKIWGAGSKKYVYEK